VSGLRPGSTVGRLRSIFSISWGRGSPSPKGTFYVVVFVKLLIDRRTRRTGPLGRLLASIMSLAKTTPLVMPASQIPALCWRLLEAWDHTAPHHLLSVLAALSQAPDTVFAQEQANGSLVSGSICGAVPVGHAVPSRQAHTRRRID
jgi:hypothetical protein